MNIVTVLPLSRGVHKDTLSYFTAKDIALGSIVGVPVRSKIIDAIVIASEPAQNIKEHLKDASFALKKIESVKGKAPFSKNFLKACTTLGEYSVASVGALIDTIVPNIYLKEYKNLKLNTHQIKVDNRQAREKYAFQAPLADRIAYYKTYIREAFARDASVFFCVPTIRDATIFAEALTRGITEHSVIVHSELPKKALIEKYNTITTNSHPLIIIGTIPFLSIPRHDVDTIIVEMEARESYKTFTRPFIDLRMVAELIARYNNVRYIVGDTLLRTETLAELSNHNFLPIGQAPAFRLAPVGNLEIIDMKAINTMGIEKSFRLIDETIEKTLSSTATKNDRMFFFVLRKGLAPTTVCNDCGEPVLCPICKRPLVLYENKTTREEKRVFVCNHCRNRENADRTCEHCGSWNLVPLGIGSERIYQQLKTLCPERKVILLDRQTVRTEREARKLIGEFYKTPGAILVGTEMAFYYLAVPIEYTIIVSLDTLFSIPSFKITERIAHLCIDAFELATKNTIIQTRMITTPIISALREKNLLALFRQELEDRKQYHYPPYGTIIKILTPEKSTDTETIETALIPYLKNKEIPYYHSKTVGLKNIQYTQITIKLARSSWYPSDLDSHASIDPELLAILQLLSPQTTIHINPENIL